MKTFLNRRQSILHSYNHTKTGIKCLKVPVLASRWAIIQVRLHVRRRPMIPWINLSHAGQGQVQVLSSPQGFHILCHLGQSRSYLLGDAIEVWQKITMKLTSSFFSDITSPSLGVSSPMMQLSIFPLQAVMSSPSKGVSFFFLKTDVLMYVSL